MRFCIHFFGNEPLKHVEKDEHIVRPIENTLILCLRATQTEPYLAMCHISIFRIQKVTKQSMNYTLSTTNEKIVFGICVFF